MEQYKLTESQQATLEGLKQPFAMYQILEGRALTLVLSDGFCELFGYADRAQAYRMINEDLFSSVHPDDRVRVADAVRRFAREGGSYDAIYRVKTKDAPGYKIVHATGRQVDEGSDSRLIHVWYTDEGDYDEESGSNGPQFSRALTDALHEESIFKASRYDLLTGLPSMTYFFELALAAKSSIMAAGHDPVLVFFDLCGMKYFNEEYGYMEGDKLLTSFARSIARAFGNECCSRFGQDHFAAFSHAEGLEEMLERLLSECGELNGGKTLPVHVGIYRNSVEDASVSTACDRAKYACDTLKGAYSSTYRYYSEEMSDAIRRQRYILENFDRALEEKWIQVWYQPIIRTVNGQVCDEEALSRWVDPTVGMLSPADFIPALEDAGLIYKLDLYVLDCVLEKIKRQQEMGLVVVPHSVNLSRSDFDSCDIAEEICKRVDAAGVARDKITIEITESVIGGDFDFMKKQIERFRDLGFPVWMDDFGSGYSSLDVLQSIKFDLIKFDMSFLQRLDEGDGGKIILTELMKMATALGVDAVCEGVETEDQVRFLREIGCSKLQGFYYCKPISFDSLVERYANGEQIGFENPEEADYYDIVGRLNLYDLAVIAADSDGELRHFFNTLPMGVIEVKGDATRFVRSNQSYRDFIKRFFDLDLSYLGTEFHPYDVSFMENIVNKCCKLGIRSYYDEKMPDGSIVHSFARRIGINPINGNVAVAVAVLSIAEPDEGATYATIARALAADYYNIFYIDLDTDSFIEYSSQVGGENIALERRGEHFFDSAKRDTMTRIYEEDREAFLAAFTKENIVRELDEQGVFTAIYRLVDTGAPVYVSMKITRMPGGNHIIMGVSVIDSQMRQKELLDRVQKERDALSRIMALSDDYLSLYSVNIDTGHYIEYSASDEFESLGIAKEGLDFFGECAVNGRQVIFSDDLPEYLERLTKENVLREIGEDGLFTLQYRLMINGEPKRVILKIAQTNDGEKERLVAGIRVWRERK